MSEFAANPDQELIERMRAGDEQALAEVFAGYRERLRRIVRFRIDYRIAGRISESDVLQETYLAAAKRLDRFSYDNAMSAFVWLRLLVGQQLIDLHRKHVLANKRDARREISLGPGTVSPHTSVAIAAQLVDRMTGASEVIARAEMIDRLEATLNEMESIDREIIALRHFEELSNLESAAVLGIEPAAASKRYLRAMIRLGELMSEFRGSL